MSVRRRAPRPIAIALALMAVAMPCAAEAATSCSVSGTQLVFGSFTSFTGLDASADPDRDTTTDLAVTCTGDPGTTVGVEIQLDGGAAGNPLGRQLRGPGTLAYNIYADAAHSQVWGDGSSGTDRSATINLPAGNPTGSATLTAYGRIPRGQRTAPIGTYGDTVLVTIVY